MSPLLMVLTPLLILAIVVLFCFAGCSEFGTAPEAPATPPPPPGTPPVTGPTYESIVAGTQGFAGHWRLNETSGTTAVVLGPLAPNLNGIYQQPGVTLGRDGALHFKDAGDHAAEVDGVNGHVDVPFDARLNPDNTLKFTIEVWAKPGAGGASTQVVISSHRIAATGKHRGYEIAFVRVAGQAHANVRGRVYSPNAAAPSEVIVTPTQGDPQAWRHLVLTYDGAAGIGGKKLTLYVGVVGTPGPVLTELAGSDYQLVNDPDTPLRFGAGHQAGGTAADFFAGLIDEVAFYNAALVKSEVETHFKASVP